MRHSLKISVSKAPQTSGVVTCKSIGIRERIFRFLFGNKQRITILIPGDNVDEVAICESVKGGGKDERGQIDAQGSSGFTHLG